MKDVVGIQLAQYQYVSANILLTLLKNSTCKVCRLLDVYNTSFYSTWKVQVGRNEVRRRNRTMP
jgi:hypothetical protein